MRALELWLLVYWLNALWQVPLVTAAGAVAARLLRRSNPAAEHRVWAATLACAAMLPACDIDFAGLLHVFDAHETIAGTQVGVAFFSTSAPMHGPPPSLLAAFAAIYGCILIGMALRLAWSCLQIAAIQRRAQPVTLTGEPAQTWARCCGFFRIHDARLAIALDFSGPVLVGFRSRTLLLPQGFLEIVAPAELETALAHEFAHMQRRDYGWNLACELLALPVAWHPAMSLLRTRLAESREMACDRLAAQALSPAHGSERYARSLLRLATVLSDRPRTIHAHAIGIFDANTLERRIMRLTEVSTCMTGARKLALVSACTVLALATFASALALRLHVDSPSSSAAGKAAQPQNDVMPKIISAVDPDYPAGARAEKNPVSGVCIVGVTVSEGGIPQDVHVVKSLRADFDRKSVEAVNQYRFTPALRNGEPVAKDINIEVNFQIF